MEKENKNISRRDFLKTATIVGAATAVGGTLAGCSSQDSSQPASWDHETDVIVVGYGMAGASTALAVDDAGAEVIILEKMDEEKGGGNSKLSANLLWIPGNREDGVTYFRAMSAENMHDISDEMVDTWIDGMLENKTWIDENLGLNLFPVPAEYGMGPEMPFLPGADAQQIYMVNGNMGNGALFLPIHDLVKSRRLNIMYETSATKLFTDDEGNVIGVSAVSAGEEITIKARKGVVLCCGSFEFNDEMKANYLRGPIYGAGNVGNTGDGVKMAQALGADLWHMNNAMGPMMMGFKSEEFGEDDYPESIRLIAVQAASFFWIDTLGKRFMDESQQAHHLHGKGLDEFYFYDGHANAFTRNPSWIIFDQSGLNAGPIAYYNNEAATTKMGFAAWYTNYQWSLDNSAELEKGWIKTGDTIEELAQEIDVDPEALAATLENFNAMAAEGADTEFSRPIIAPLTGPFYAIQQYPGMVNCQGGPKRNENAEVLHVEGHPIPRLYSAGECGAIYGWQYQGGGNLGECLCFGRIAGKNAAANESL